MISNNRIHGYEQVLRADDEILSQKAGMDGFSLIELLISMVITLVILGVAVTTFSNALSSRERESSKTDAITSTQAALNIVTREVGNSGYGLETNGIVASDSTTKILHIRANLNNDSDTGDIGEDITFYYDEDSKSVVRYDAFDGSTSGIINRVSDVDFVYFNYNGATGANTPGAASEDTGRVNIKLQVVLANVRGQPSNQKVNVNSDVTLRNSTYMLGRY